jgi:ubiquinone/menaquinone biosynthesis C-methylase UbiE
MTACSGHISLTSLITVFWNVPETSLTAHRIEGQPFQTEEESRDERAGIELAWQHDESDDAFALAGRLADQARAVRLRMMMESYRAPQAIYAAARLGLADLLNDGPKTVSELAEATNTLAPGLRRLMSALGSLGVFAEQEDGRFALTPMGACLRSGQPNSQRNWVLIFGDIYYRAWTGLLDCLHDGKPGFDHVHRMGLYDYMARNPATAKIWDELMDDMSREWIIPIAHTYDFSGVNTIIDIGGGRGALIAEILKVNPQMRGILFDLPHVVKIAVDVLEAAGVADRCETVAGDVFESVPDGADAYLLARVLFNWSDEDATAILKSCRRAMSRKAKLLVIENVMPSRNASPFHKLLDLSIMVTFPGRLRTEAELQDLLAATGFKAGNISRLPFISVIEALPV